jgi:cell division septal protein FtsQ
MPNPRQVVDACGRALRRSAPVLVALAVAAMVTAGAGFGVRWLTTTPRFAVAHVEIRGANHVDVATITAELPFAIGDNMFRLDTAAAERVLRTEPWISKASVRRRLPRTIIVDLVERTAAAVVDADGLYLADQRGHAFKRADLSRGESESLPIISGIPRALFVEAPDQAAEQVRIGLAVMSAWSSVARPRAGEIKLEPTGATIYTYDDAIAVRVGTVAPDALADHLARFDAAWAALSPDERHRLRTMRVDNGTRTDLVTVAFTN